MKTNYKFENDSYHIYYNPQGCDTNGNFGPELSDPNWICVEVPRSIANDSNVRQVALTLLPNNAIEHITNCIEKFNKRNNTTHSINDIQEFAGNTCFWGAGFDFRVGEFSELEELFY